LNPDLDRIALADAYHRIGRVRIPDILTKLSAQHVYRALEQETPWGLTCNNGKEEHEFASVSAEDHQQMAIAAWERAHTRFQYFYHNWHLLEGGRMRPAPDQYLGRLIKFMVSSRFLDFIGEVTGDSSINWLTATATLFKPLDFLTLHDDEHANSDRVVAFVLSMTPEWRPDWGGALQFYDSKDHIEEGYLPTFNALNLFRIPKLHSVSQVSAFGGMRYSISGWFEARKPAGEPG
jgi:Rps23 Pro-64 3,4-dihydroxylase Tpa1-like proline 4-hydroxylase